MLKRRRRLTNRTLDCLETLISTSMLPCVEVLGLQSNADSSVWHVNISVEASAKNAHGLQRDSDLLWPVHAIVVRSTDPTDPDIRSAYPAQPKPTSATHDTGAERHSRVC
jgi:hypothetical protein